MPVRRQGGETHESTGVETRVAYAVRSRLYRAPFGGMGKGWQRVMPSMFMTR